jgi:hypothetical protein
LSNEETSGSTYLTHGLAALGLFGIIPPGLINIRIAADR